MQEKDQRELLLCNMRTADRQAALALHLSYPQIPRKPLLKPGQSHPGTGWHEQQSPGKSHSGQEGKLGKQLRLFQVKERTHSAPC